MLKLYRKVNFPFKIEALHFHLSSLTEDVQGGGGDGNKKRRSMGAGVPLRLPGHQTPAKEQLTW